MPIYPVLNEKKKPIKKDGLTKYKVRYNYVDRNGKSHQLTRIAYGMDAAKALEDEMVEEFSDKHSNSSMTVKELYDTYINAQQYKVERTSLEGAKKKLRNHVLPMFEDKRIDKLTKKDMEEWKHYIEEKRNNDDKPLKHTTKTNIYKSFNALLNYAVNMDYLRTNPLKKVGGFVALGLEALDNEEMDFYTTEEFTKFITVAKQSAIEYENQNNSIFEWHFYTFFYILFGAGPRKGEAYGIKWSDLPNEILGDSFVTLGDSLLPIKRSIAQQTKKNGADIVGPPKNKKTRSTPITRQLVKVLHVHYLRCKQLNDFSMDWYVCGGPKSIRNTTINKMNKKYSKLAEIKKIRIHDFRHSYATLLINNRVLPKEVARRIGNTEQEVMRTYAHLYPEESTFASSILENNLPNL